MADKRCTRSSTKKYDKESLKPPNTKKRQEVAKRLDLVEKDTHRDIPNHVKKYVDDQVNTYKKKLERFESKYGTMKEVLESVEE